MRYPQLVLYYERWSHKRHSRQLCFEEPRKASCYDLRCIVGGEIFFSFFQRGLTIGYAVVNIYI